MSDDGKGKSWALVISPDYRKESKRLPPKYLNQISRKTQDLMLDPTPGGSRTALTQYEGLCRLRAGEFRIIYAYNDTVVELLSLRRRDESTYDDLDHLEVEQLEPFLKITSARSAKQHLPDWKALAEKWVAPRPGAPEPLPRSITPEMLERLGVLGEYREALLRMRTVEDLLGCEQVPPHISEQVLECVSPTSATLEPGEPEGVVVQEDLLDDAAAAVSGPIDTTDRSTRLNRPNSTARELVRDQLPTPLRLVATRRNNSMPPYSGNVSRGIGKDARYTAKLDGSVQLTYSINSVERALLTTDAHRDLVTLVSAAKVAGGGSQGGGGFMINEYRHVLVPTQSGEVLFAGVYTRDLEFVFEDSVISPVARSGIAPGDEWPGPHVGIKYTLSAGATDIRYELDTSTGTSRRVSLSDFHSPADLAALLRACRAQKPSGGALYLNEARELFAPVPRDGSYAYIYVGHLGRWPWFPPPH